MAKQVRNTSQNPRRLRVEKLEERKLLAVLAVQNNLDDTLANLAGDGELSLREAIEIANNPGTVIDGFSSTDVADEIVFESSVFLGGDASLIRLHGAELEITETLTIDGAGGVDVTITGDTNDDDVSDENHITDVAASFGEVVGAANDFLDDNSRVLNFSNEAGDLSLRGLVITGGRTTGNNIVTREDTFNGGGVRFNSVGEILLQGAMIAGNSTTGDFARGGGVYAEGALHLINSSVSGNSTLGYSAPGGGVYGSEVRLSSSVVSENSTAGFIAETGGIRATSLLTLHDSAISGNSTTGDFAYGGGLWAPMVNISDSVIQQNSTYGEGSLGAGMLGGSISIVRSVVADNRTLGYAAAGGGIVGETIDIVSSTISGNSTAGELSYGGGIYSRETLAITDSSVHSNSTSGPDAYGGGIHSRSRFSSEDNLVITNSIVSSNRTTGSNSVGGGIFARLGNVRLISSTVTGNRTLAPNAGGAGLYLDPVRSPTVVASHSIIALNDAASRSLGPDLLLVTDAIPEITFSLVGDTSAGIAPDQLAAMEIGIGNLLNVDPLLGPLADNGGPTQTHALLPGSPALDAGDPAIGFDPGEFDQRGAPFSRVATGMLSGVPQQRIDIGAYEAQSPPSADFVDDDHLNGQDFLAWQFGLGLTENATRAEGDSDGDGDVDLSDLAAWRVSYGQTEAPPPPGAALGGRAQGSGVREGALDAVLAMMVKEGEDLSEGIVDQAFVEVVPDQRDESFLSSVAAVAETSASHSEPTNEEDAFVVEVGEDLLGFGL